MVESHVKTVGSEATGSSIVVSAVLSRARM